MRQTILPALLLAALAGCQLPGASDGLSGAPAAYARMTETDIAEATQALQLSLERDPPGTARAWSNPATGNAGVITPQAIFVTDLGVFCREYDERLHIGGGDVSVRNTACRSSDGTWRWVR